MPPCELISASNGASFQLSDLYFPSFLDLKQFVGETFHISVDDILLLLSYGIILKRSQWDSTKIRSEGLKSIYVFDRKLFNEDIELAVEERFRLFKPLDSPMSDLSEVDRNIVLRNMGWLKALQSDVEFFQLSIEQTRKEVQNMLDCGVVMLEYLKNYCHEVETLYNSHVGFLNKLHEHSASSQWREVYDSVLEAVKIDQQRSLASFFQIDELNQIEAKIRHTDHELNMKLKELKKTIDTCYQHRKTLVSELENIKSISVVSADCMDKQMTDKFNEMAQELEAASNEWVQNSENNDHISEKVKQMKDSHIPNLQTISQSLFNKASKIIETKTDMQRQLRSLYISVAKSQMDIIEVKSTLTKDMKSDMKLLQTYELQLSQVLDLPMCYGLYLIELYRQQLWMDNYTHIKDQHESALQVMLQEEIHQRKMWFRDFQWISKFLKVDQSLPSTVSITPLKALRRVDLLQINEYFNQLSSAKVSETTLNVLKSKLSQAEMDNILPELSEQSSNDTGAAIEGYKSRIKKLENLLLDAQFQRYDSWPSGILNKEIAMVQMFRNNTLNNKVQRSSTDDISNSIQQSYSKTLGDVQNLQKAISEYSGLTDTLKEELSTLKSQISNMEVEKNAYKESMANLNKELSNLLINRENFHTEMMERSNDFKKHLALVGEENEQLTKQNQQLSNEIIESQKKYEELNKIKDDLLLNMANQETQAEQERAALQEEIESLKKEVGQLQMAKSSLTESEELLGINKQLEKTLYDVFQGSIFLLESIGLLLSKDIDGKFQIVRVKGLRKDLDSSVIDMNGSLVKSVVSHEIKDTFESIKDSLDYKPHENFISYTEKLFGNQLFEMAVIRRFNDIESLAKKLRKENKNKKILLQKYTNDKITINNFQLGDLALFLPINDQELLLNSSVSSLNSSFSSIDLNSSTQSMIPPRVIPNRVEPASNTNNSNSSSVPEDMGSPNMNRVNTMGNVKVNANIGSNNSNNNYVNTGNANGNNKPETNIDTTSSTNAETPKKQIVWAIFTATNTEVKYILRNTMSNYELLREKEWAVGRITALEKNIVMEGARNPFKFPQNTVWFEVDALFNLS